MKLAELSQNIQQCQLNVKTHSQTALVEFLEAWAARLPPGVRSVTWVQGIQWKHEYFIRQHMLTQVKPKYVRPASRKYYEEVDGWLTLVDDYGLTVQVQSLINELADIDDQIVEAAFGHNKRVTVHCDDFRVDVEDCDDPF